MSCSIISSKASTDFGNGSGGEAAGSGEAAAAVEGATEAGGTPFEELRGPSTEVAMSSSLEVAASSLFRHQLLVEKCLRDVYRVVLLLTNWTQAELTF